MRSNLLRVLLIAFAFGLISLSDFGTHSSYPQAFAAVESQADEEDEPIFGLDFEIEGELFVDEAIVFTATVQSGTNVRYQWDFGDGSISPIVEGPVLYAFPNPGTFNIKLRAQNSEGSTTVIRQVTIQRRPLPSLGISVSGNRNVDSSITFEAIFDQDVNTAVRYVWDFGDGRNLGTTGNPVSHIYDSADTYTVEVVAINLEDENHRSSASIQITVTPAQINISKWPYVVSPTGRTPYTGEEVKFALETSSGSNISYRWDFGDGTPGTTTTEPANSHEFGASGRYKVVVTVSNSSGSVSNEFDNTLFIVVEDEPKRPISGLHVFCEEQDESPSLIYCAALVDEGEPDTYLWDFGDGNSVEGSSVIEHSYAMTGTYDILVTAIGQRVGVPGGVDVLQNQTIVDVQSVIGEGGVPIIAVGGNGLLLVDRDSWFTLSKPFAEAVKYIWYFGNGDSKTNNNPTNLTVNYPYPEFGRYIVRVTGLNAEDKEVGTARVAVSVRDAIYAPITPR